MNKVLIGLILIVGSMLGTGGAVFAQSPTPTAPADGSTVYVCRDPRYGTVRHEFHNIPAEWLTGNPVGIWLLADGFSMYPEAGVVVTDALVPESLGMNNEGVEVGQSILGVTDYSFEIRGDANSPACDPALSPVQEDGSVSAVATPVPTVEPSVSSVSVASIDSCVYPELKAWNGVRGIYYCYTPINALGVAPILPPPSA